MVKLRLGSQVMQVRSVPAEQVAQEWWQGAHRVVGVAELEGIVELAEANAVVEDNLAVQRGVRRGSTK